MNLPNVVEYIAYRHVITLPSSYKLLFDYTNNTTQDSAANNCLGGLEE